MDKQRPPWLKPFISRIFKTSVDSLEFFETLVKNTDIVRLPVFRPNYIVNDPEAIHHILLTNRDNYTKAGTSYERIENVVGRGLLTTSGTDWATRRQQFQSKFHGKHLKNLVPIIHKYTERLINVWEKKRGGSINISEEMLSLVMNISSEAFIGVDVSSRSLEMVRLIHILNNNSVRSLILWKWLPTLRNVRYQAAKKTLDNFILDSLKNPQESSQEPLLESLLHKDEAGNLLLSDQDILGEVKNFFVAGHETTGNAICWTLYCLAKNPYVLLQVMDEIKQALNGRQPDFDNIDDLPYLDMVIDEALRLYPAIWIFTRRAIQEDELLNYTIPADSIINILPYLIHRHPKYWNQPTVFYPERFLESSSRGRPKCSYIPFGFGPRVCIGKQFALLNMKIILVMLLQRFELKLPSKNYVVKPLPLITLKPEKGLFLRIEKRE